MELIFRAWFVLTVVFVNLSEKGDGSLGDECTAGFMSLDRIDAVLDKYMYGRSLTTSNEFQVVFPGVNFTCNGSILSWIFGAAMADNGNSFPELQIWRRRGDGSYFKVGHTIINVTEESTTQLYYYHLSSPLQFQEGDILGYYQSDGSESRLQLYAEKDGQGRQIGHFIFNPHSAYSELSSLPIQAESDYQNFINIETDSPSCGCGFMSVERMRILLGLDTVNERSLYPQRQQITPDMRFTCDGWITKWIIGASVASGSLYPELQVWRNTTNTYQKINGTSIVIPDAGGNKSYEYDNFHPIAIQAGDILGVFLPPAASSRLTLWSEDTTSPINYYLTTDSTDYESPYDMIDLENTPSVMSQDYHLLVSVEIATTSPTQADKSQTSIMIMATTTSLQSHSVTFTPTPSNSLSNTVVPKPSPDDPSYVAAAIGGGIGAAIIFLAALLVTALVCVLRQKKHKKAMDLQQYSSYSPFRRDSPVYYTVGAPTASPPQPPQDDCKGDHYEVIKEDTPAYNATDHYEVIKEDTPAYNATDDPEYAVVSLNRVGSPTPLKESDEDIIYRKFTNPLYTDLPRDK